MARSDECKTIRHTRAAQSPSTHAEKGDRARERDREREAGRAKSVTSNMHQLILSLSHTHTYRDRHLYICNLKMLIGNQNGGELPAVAVAVAASSVGSRQVRFVVAR